MIIIFCITYDANSFFCLAKIGRTFVHLIICILCMTKWSDETIYLGDRVSLFVFVDLPASRNSAGTPLGY